MMDARVLGNKLILTPERGDVLVFTLNGASISTWSVQRRRSVLARFFGRVWCSKWVTEIELTVMSTPT